MNQIKWYEKTCLSLWIEPSMFGYISTTIDCRMITWFYIIRWFTVIVYQIVSSKYTMNNNVSSLFCRKWRSNDRLVNGVIYPHTQCNYTLCCVIDIDISRNVWRIVINYSTQKNRYGYGVFFTPGILTTWTSMSSMSSMISIWKNAKTAIISFPLHTVAKTCRLDGQVQ